MKKKKARNIFWVLLAVSALVFQTVILPWYVGAVPSAPHPDKPGYGETFVEIHYNNITEAFEFWFWARNDEPGEANGLWDWAFYTDKAEWDAEAYDDAEWGWCVLPDFSVPFNKHEMEYWLPVFDRYFAAGSEYNHAGDPGKSMPDQKVTFINKSGMVVSDLVLNIYALESPDNRFYDRPWNDPSQWPPRLGSRTIVDDCLPYDYATEDPPDPHSYITVDISYKVGTSGALTALPYPTLSGYLDDLYNYPYADPVNKPRIRFFNPDGKNGSPNPEDWGTDYTIPGSLGVNETLTLTFSNLFLLGSPSQGGVGNRYEGLEALCGFRPKSGSPMIPVVIGGTKRVEGPAPEQPFGFTLTQLNSPDLNDVMSAANGGVTRTVWVPTNGPDDYPFSFDEVLLDPKAQTPYYFRVEETSGGPGPNWTNDTDPRLVTVTIVGGAATYTYADQSEGVFTNVYRSSTGSEASDVIGGIKRVAGDNPAPDQTFEFTLTQLNSDDPDDVTENGIELKKLVPTSGLGDYYFSFDEVLSDLRAQDSPYYFKLQETSGGPDANWTNDTEPRVVTVILEGEALTYTYANQSGVIFTNVYRGGGEGSTPSPSPSPTTKPGGNDDYYRPDTSPTPTPTVTPTGVPSQPPGTLTPTTPGPSEDVTVPTETVPGGPGDVTKPPTITIAPTDEPGGVETPRPNPPTFAFVNIGETGYPFASAILLGGITLILILFRRRKKREDEEA